MKTKALSRAERELQIITLLAIKIQNGGDNTITCNQVAKSLGLSPSTKLRNIMLDMWRAGKLDAYEIWHQGCCKKAYVFMLPEGSYIPPKKPTRTIDVKVNGRSEQLVQL